MHTQARSSSGWGVDSDSDDDVTPEPRCKTCTYNWPFAKHARQCSSTCAQGYRYTIAVLLKSTSAVSVVLPPSHALTAFPVPLLPLLEMTPSPFSTVT